MSDIPSTFRFVVTGQLEGELRGAEASPPAALAGGRIKRSVRMGALRAGNDTHVLEAVAGQDFVVLELANGPPLVLHPATARDLFAAQSGAGAPSRAAAAPSSGPGDAPIDTPVSLAWAGLGPVASGRGARGSLGGVLASAFHIVTGKTLDRAAELMAQEVRDRVDGQVEPGVYPLRPDVLEPLTSGRLDAVPAPPQDKPLIVLVHGTFVDTAKTFRSLWVMHPEQVAELFARYEGRVYGFDHPTLGQTPLANARMLAAALPAGARVHLLTHSRGGLVAEALARAASGEVSIDEARAAFDQDPAAQGDLLELSRIVREKNIRVERMVRVACPARGTTLASKRLDAYLSAFHWVLDLAKIPVLPALVDFLAEVARQGIQPDTVPGLAAMTPDSSFLTWLSGARDAIPGDLRVVAGDMRGDSLVSWLKTLVSDAFFWTDNDLVVQTRSMYGGAPRAAGAGFVLDAGSAVSHFNYFSNDTTAQAILAGLTQDTPKSYRAIGPLSWAGQDAGGARDARPSASLPELPAVFLLPGILGTNLKVGGDRVWLGPRLVGGFEKLRYQAGASDGVSPDGLLGPCYDALAAFLRRSHEVISFGFDWRRPLEDEAARLAAAVDEALDRRAATGRPVRLLAHSMGGLLARTMELEHPQTWKRMMGRDGARLVMLGTPNAGSWVPMKVLSGDDRLGNLLALVGQPLREGRARQEMATMPGLLQLQAGLADGANRLDTAEAWARLAAEDLDFVKAHGVWHRVALQLGLYDWGLPTQEVLDRALALRRRLDQQVKEGIAEDAAKMALVVGHAPFTPDGFAVSAEGLRYLELPEDGDGTVTHASTALPGVAAWRVDCAHAELPALERSFEAFLDLLETGRTTRLERLPGAVGRGADGSPAPASRARVARRPARLTGGIAPPEDPRDLLGAADRQAVTEVAPASAQALRVTVQNGNLKFVRQPLLVGHYRSLRLTGAERDVDLLIRGTMRESLAAGHYPDAPSSHQVFVNRRADDENPWRTPQPESVIVVGLGEEGQLRPSDLSSTVMHGVVAWAQRMVESPAGAPASFALAATLIGSGGLGVTAGAAARAIAQGVRDANERLLAAGGDWPRASQLLLVELYADRAAEAWQGLMVQAAAEPGSYQIDECVQEGVGSLPRSLDMDYRGTDYDLVTATSEDGAGEGTIRYTLDTKRARAEVRAQSTQGKLLDELLATAPRGDDPRIGRTLFELLVPVDLEPFLSGTDQMVLELDARTAAIPWELLDTPSGTRSPSDRPFCIRTQLVRKLRVQEFRAAVADATDDEHVLVVGAPRCDPARYPELPGARAEALAVARALAGEGGLGNSGLHALDQPDAVQVLNELHARPYRIVHVAGHGEPGDSGGVVLSGGTFLGWHEIRSMRCVPQLVFINCCHAGAVRAPRPGEPPRGAVAMAASAAEALIRLGVRCVVAAGWAVSDAGAEKFALTFYGALLEGRPFAEAVAEARSAAWERRASGDDTWAAYQCYGDPHWTFRAGVGAGAGTRGPAARFAKLATSAGLQLALQTLVVERRFQGAGGGAAGEAVRHLEARFARVWGSQGAVAEAFGAAYAEQGDLDRAIGWYEAAFRAEDATSSMRAGRTLGNLRARRAWERLDEASRRRQPLDRLVEEGRRELDEARDLLGALGRLQPTIENAELCGSVAKRRAMLERVAYEQRLAPDDRAEVAAIEEMVAGYRDAEERARRAGQPSESGWVLQRLAGEFRLGAPAERLLVALGALDGPIEERARTAPDFWSLANRTHALFLRALWTRALAERADSLAQGYRALFDRVKTIPMWTSVYDQARFVLPSTALDAEAAAGRKLLQVLAAFCGKST